MRIKQVGSSVRSGHVHHVLEATRMTLKRHWSLRSSSCDNGIVAVMEITAQTIVVAGRAVDTELKQVSHRSNRRTWNRSGHDDRKATLDCAGRE